jgi:predicted DNA-binding transcriptional regulator YafY
VTVRKAERLLNLIAYLLETSRPVTPHQIQETIPGYDEKSWQAFQRMFERDKEELREMGIPVELAPTDVWESEEGYRIPKERYYLKQLDLAEDEIAVLFMAAGLLRLPDPGAARAALLKLTGDVPPEAARTSLSWLAADLGLSAEGLPRAFQAVSDRKRLKFSYPSRDGKPAQRTVDPFGLVHRRGAWYLVGRDHRTDDVKSFRLDRMVGEVYLVDPSLPGPEFEVPEGFRPEAALEAPPFVQGEPKISARIRFDAATAWRVERESPWLDLRFFEDSSAEADVEVTEPSGFISWILWFGEGAELIEPAELRHELLRRLEEICD